MRGLEDQVAGILDDRLSHLSRRPLAVALSGGGDSLALTLLASTWAEAAGRRLLILTVDHGVQARSGAWTAACAAVAARLGHPFRALRWEGPKPASGLPAAARRARHELLADAAREAGACVILMGHTADDVAEARLMRDAGGSTPDPRLWAPSPAWPQGRGMFVLRPLLDIRRGRLRDWLAARGERWIEDPANADPRYARSRARRLADPEGAVPRVERPPLRLAGQVTETDGVLSLPRAALREAALADTQRLLAIACVCAGGGDRRPATAAIVRAAARLRLDGPTTFTLAGARVEADDAMARIAREAAEAARGGLAPLELPCGREVVWDGRYALTARVAGLRVRATRGVARRLAPDQRQRLLALPPIARGALPAIVGAGDTACSPTLAADATVASTCLILPRLRAAAGLTTREPD